MEGSTFFIQVFFCFLFTPKNSSNFFFHRVQASDRMSKSTTSTLKAKSKSLICWE